MKLPPPHKVAAAFMAIGFGLNLEAGRRGLRTICTAAREHLRLDTLAGRAATAAGIGLAMVGFGQHLLNPSKRPVRALARLAELVDDARVEF